MRNYCHTHCRFCSFFQGSMAASRGLLERESHNILVVRLPLFPLFGVCILVFTTTVRLYSLASFLSWSSRYLIWKEDRQILSSSSKGKSGSKVVVNAFTYLASGRPSHPVYIWLGLCHEFMSLLSSYTSQMQAKPEPEISAA